MTIKKMEGNIVNHTLNATTSVNDYDYSQRPETYIVPVLFALIFFVGVIGNGSLVMIFLKHKHMINVPNIYILSLALGDLLVLLSNIPFTSTVYTVIVENCTYCFKRPQKYSSNYVVFAIMYEPM